MDNQAGCNVLNKSRGCATHVALANPLSHPAHAEKKNEARARAASDSVARTQPSLHVARRHNLRNRRATCQSLTLADDCTCLHVRISSTLSPPDTHKRGAEGLKTTPDGERSGQAAGMAAAAARLLHHRSTAFCRHILVRSGAA